MSQLKPILLVESYQLGVNAYVVKPLGFQGFVDAKGQLGLGGAERVAAGARNP